VYWYAKSYNIHWKCNSLYDPFHIFNVALLENHVVPHVMCTPVITEEYKARNLGPSGRLAFDCDEKGHSVENKRLSGEFILGQNGIVYMIDDVLVPDRGNARF